MKIQRAFRLLASVAFFLASTSVSFSGSESGGNSSGGGDEYSREFREIGEGLAKKISQAHLQQVYGFSLSDFQEAVRKVRVITVQVACLVAQRPCPRRFIRDAVNNPPGERLGEVIHLSSGRWYLLRQSPELAERLVAHEYFGILGIERDSDERSRMVLALLNGPQKLQKNPNRNPSCFHRCLENQTLERNACKVLRFLADRARCESEVDSRINRAVCEQRCKQDSEYDYEPAPPPIELRGPPLSPECEQKSKAILPAMGVKVCQGSDAYKQAISALKWKECGNPRAGIQQFSAYDFLEIDGKKLRADDFVNETPVPLKVALFSFFVRPVSESCVVVRGDFRIDLFGKSNWKSTEDFLGRTSYQRLRVNLTEDRWISSIDLGSLTTMDGLPDFLSPPVSGHELWLPTDRDVVRDGYIDSAEYRSTLKKDFQGFLSY